MLRDLASSVDCAVGPSGVNPLKALADAVDGSAFHASAALDHADGSAAAFDARARGAGPSGSASAAAYAPHDAFAAHFASGRKQPAHPVLERAWAENGLHLHSQPSAALDAAWAASAARAPPPALAPRALADVNPAVIECVRAFARADDGAPVLHLRQLAAQMARSLAPEQRARAATRAATHARLSLIHI